MITICNHHTTLLGQGASHFSEDAARQINTATAIQMYSPTMQIICAMHFEEGHSLRLNAQAVSFRSGSAALPVLSSSPVLAAAGSFKVSSLADLLSQH